MREKSIIKENILKYLDYKRVSKYEFYKISGVSNGVLSQNSGMSEENILRFLSHFKDVNIDWLLTGKGEMIKGSQKSSYADNSELLKDGEPSESLKTQSQKDQTINALEKVIAAQDKTIRSLEQQLQQFKNHETNKKL